MSYKSSRELAREKIERAEAALEEYVRSGEGDCEHHKFLISAVTMARCGNLLKCWRFSGQPK